MSQSSEVNSFSARDSPWERRFIAVSRGCHLFGMAFMVIMAVVTVVSSVGRYGFNLPITGLLEISGFMMVIAIFLIGAYTMAEKEHIAMGMVVERLSERTQAIISSVTYLLCLVFTGIAAWQAYVRGTLIMQEGRVSEILHTPLFPFLYIVGIGWTLFSLVILMQLIAYVLRAVRK